MYGVAGYGHDDDVGINDHFRTLKGRIQRSTPYKLYKSGYLSSSELSYYYHHKDIFKPLIMQYFKVQTNEGNGVLHILYRGSYLPYNYLADNWMDIHNSWDINIMKVDLSDTNKVSSYVVNQYVSHQDATFVRSSQSWDWVHRGYTSIMNRLRRDYPATYRQLWDDYLNNYADQHFTVTLDDFSWRLPTSMG